MPEHVISDVCQLFRQLGAVPKNLLPATPTGWPADGDTPTFARQLTTVTQNVYNRFSADFGDLYTAFGIPADPLESILSDWAQLASRPFQLLHTDLHRKNMICSRGRTYFLDWELALWGDPVYDLAVHLHKMAYRPDEAELVIDGWLAVAARGATTDWRADLEKYLRHEQVKSAIVDSVRYTRLIASHGVTAAEEALLIGKLVDKLAAARASLGLAPCIDLATASEVIHRWAEVSSQGYSAEG